MVGWLKFNIIEKIPFMVYLEIQCITFKMEKSFIAHPWIKRSVVGLEEYSAHDWRAATSGTARSSYLARVGPVVVSKWPVHCRWYFQMYFLWSKMTILFKFNLAYNSRCIDKKSPLHHVMVCGRAAEKRSHYMILIEFGIWWLQPQIHCAHSKTTVLFWNIQMSLWLDRCK